MNNGKICLRELKARGVPLGCLWRLCGGQRALRVLFSSVAGGKRIYFGEVSKWVITALQVGDNQAASESAEAP